MRACSVFVFALAAISSVVAHPIHNHARELRVIGRETSAKVAARAAAPEFEVLTTGNQAFRDNIAKSDPGLLQKLADDGQEPPFMFIGCSDSRVSEGTVFNAKPGTFFTQRNIANQFQSGDANVHSVLSYAVAELGVNHVIVMGHYGCGGVAAAIASAPANQIDAANGAIQGWIEPIREIFRTSNRSEIVELRTKNAALSVVEEPDIQEPGFRALVEENVKAGVARIAKDTVISNHFALLANNASTISRRSGEAAAVTNVFIHGWVYDIENGEVRDLGISVGPAGVAIPDPPFAAVVKSATEAAGTHSSASTTTAKSTTAASASAHATTAATKTEKASASSSATKASASASVSTTTSAAATESSKAVAGVHVVSMKY